MAKTSGVMPNASQSSWRRMRATLSLFQPKCALKTPPGSLSMRNTSVLKRNGATTYRLLANESERTYGPVNAIAKGASATIHEIPISNNGNGAACNMAMTSEPSVKPILSVDNRPTLWLMYSYSVASGDRMRSSTPSNNARETVATMCSRKDSTVPAYTSRHVLGEVTLLTASHGSPQVPAKPTGALGIHNRF